MVAARFHPTFAQWYSTHIYPIFVSVIGRLSSMVSFSFVELSLYVMSLLIIGTGIHALASARKNRKTAVLQWISALFLGACILFFLFVINCGINYQKESFADTAGLKVRPYSVEELTATCQWLTEEVNRLSAQVQRSDQKDCSCLMIYKKKQYAPCRASEEHTLAFRAIIPLQSRFSSLKFYPGRN